MRDSEIKVSIGIPVYGVENYIERCARSLFEQTMVEGIEFIFVNDCTKDRSIEILKRVLEEYPGRKNQTKIIHSSKNEGSATTRNIIRRYAAGKYLIFCDSDDWVEPDIYASLLSEAEATDSDMVICGFKWEYPGKSQSEMIPVLASSADYVEYMLAGKIHCSTGNKLIKRELYYKAQVSFPDGTNMWEDVNVIIPLTFHCDKIAVISRPLYHYNQSNAASYTHRLTDQSLLAMRKTITNLEIFAAYTGNSYIIEALNYFKLTARLNLMLNADMKDLKNLPYLYPEANKYIWTYQVMSVYWRAGLWLASKRQIWLFRVLAWIKKSTA